MQDNECIHCTIRLAFTHRTPKNTEGHVRDSVKIAQDIMGEMISMEALSHDAVSFNIFTKSALTKAAWATLMLVCQITYQM